MQVCTWCVRQCGGAVAAASVRSGGVQVRSKGAAVPPGVRALQACCVISLLSIFIFSACRLSFAVIFHFRRFSPFFSHFFRRLLQHATSFLHAFRPSPAVSPICQPGLPDAAIRHFADFAIASCHATRYAAMPSPALSAAIFSPSITLIFIASHCRLHAIFCHCFFFFARCARCAQSARSH